MKDAWVNASVKVSVDECMSAVEHALLPAMDVFPDEALVRRLDELHAKVMKRWISPGERCKECGGSGECAGGSHSWTCHACRGRGREGE